MTTPSPQTYDVPVDNPKHASNEQNIHTPPASDMSSHGRKEDDDDDEAAGSSSDLSDLDDQFEGEAPSTPVVEPDRYEGGIPIFQPTMDQFQDFEKYMNAVNPYGMKSGIVLIDPPPEWKAERKALDDMVKGIKVRNPITQEFHHNEYGIYTQRNMEKMRTYNLPQWKAVCEQSQYQPPARRGERRNKAGTGPGAKIVPLKRKSEPLPLPDGVRRKAGRPRVKLDQEQNVDAEKDDVAPPTPVSPDQSRIDPVKHENIETPQPTPTKRTKKPARRKAQSGAGTKKASAKAGGEKATTVAARRLHNAADIAANDFNEEDFQDFDYRIHNHHEWTKERCKELEEKYWKSLSYTNPMYGADMPGSLFDDDTKCWNVAKLPNLLDILGSQIPGVNTAYLYLGMWRATFAWHLEDVDLYSINYIHFGAPKQWYSISQADAPKFEKAMRSIYASEAKDCNQFLRHKTFLVSPSLLKNKYGVTVNRVVHREGQFVVTFPIGYHSGYNLGYNCAESVNFALESWLPYGKIAKKCQCEDDSVFIDVDWFIRRLNGEPTPEVEEWVEVTDDEDDPRGPTDLPTPPGSDRGQFKLGKRKRQATKAGTGKKTKKIKIKISRTGIPCCLCPNNFDCDELLPTEDNRRAHRRCALYTPETYFDEVDGRELIRGMAEISKARLELRCNECRQKRGSCFQCSSAKCTRAYHATCAAQAGVQVDISDVAIWHEGVEYRDTGLDFRCKLHRSVKTAKHSSDLARDNYRHIQKDTREFNAYLIGLKANDIVQFQSSSSDDIEAGVLVESMDEEEGILILDLLPTRQRRYIESNTVLFVNSATSCLQKPSANAKDFPKHLRGKALSWEDNTNRKPSRLDPFCSGLDQSMAYRWEEFSSTTPAANENQKAVDFSQDRRLWYYLGSQSTESKAYYTGDPSLPVYDTSSNFLQSVEPAKRPLPAQPHLGRRPSLPASYQAQYCANPIISASSIVAAVPPMSMEEHLRQRSQKDYQRRMSMTTNSNSSITPTSYAGRYSPASAPQIYPNVNRPRMPVDLTVNSGAMLGKSRTILEAPEGQAAAFSNQAELRSGSKPKLPMPPRSISIDAQSVERQRDFQRQAYKQSLSSTQLSSHSPGSRPGSVGNRASSHHGHTPGPNQGTGAAAPQRPPNIVHHTNKSPMAREANSSTVLGPYSSPISFQPVAQLNNKQAANNPTSPRFASHQQAPLQPANIKFSEPSPTSVASHIPSPNPAKPSTAKSTPCDIPQSRQQPFARTQEHGVQMPNSVGPGFTGNKIGYGNSPAPSRPVSALQGISGEVIGCMPPPASPRRSSQLPVALDAHGTKDQDAKPTFTTGSAHGPLSQWKAAASDRSNLSTTQKTPSSSLSDPNCTKPRLQPKAPSATISDRGGMSSFSHSQNGAVNRSSLLQAGSDAGTIMNGPASKPNETAVGFIAPKANGRSPLSPANDLPTASVRQSADFKPDEDQTRIAQATASTDTTTANPINIPVSCDDDPDTGTGTGAVETVSASSSNDNAGSDSHTNNESNKLLSTSFYTTLTEDEKRLIDRERDRMVGSGCSS